MKSWSTAVAVVGKSYSFAVFRGASDCKHSIQNKAELERMIGSRGAGLTVSTSILHSHLNDGGGIVGAP